MPPSKKRIETSFDMSSGMTDFIEVDDGRHNYFSFRVTDKEKEKIEKNIEKSRLKKSDYLRKCTLGKDIIVVDGLKELALAVGRIGNNINQIAKAVHSGRVADTGELEKLEIEYKKAFETIYKLSKR
jgi:hypothetical protein